MATFYGQWYKSTIFPTRVANLQWNGVDLKAKVDSMTLQFYSLTSVIASYPSFPGSSKCRCLAKKIVYAESTWNPNAINQNANGSTDYGLWQMNTIHSTDYWWPTKNGLTLNTLYNAEYNTRCAFTLMHNKLNQGKNPWQDWSSYDNVASSCL